MLPHFRLQVIAEGVGSAPRLASSSLTFCSFNKDPVDVSNSTSVAAVLVVVVVVLLLAQKLKVSAPPLLQQLAWTNGAKVQHLL